MAKLTVKFIPDNKTVEVEKDRTIASAALSAGVPLNAACGGDGVCGRCRVLVRKGQVGALATGRMSLADMRKGLYLACQTTVQSDLEVEVPAESRLDMDRLSAEEIDRRLKGFYGPSEDVQSLEAAAPVKPAFTGSALTEKLYLELPPPTLQDCISDLERLYRQIQAQKDYIPEHAGLAAIRLLGELLRSAQWKVTATVGKRYGIIELLDVEPGDTASRNFGLVFDIGTTTVSGQLVDLQSARVLGTRATYNKQASFGSDVITRIMYAQKEEGLEKLHQAVVESMNAITHDLAAENSIDLNDVTCVVCAGNTTMIHLLLRIDPTYIRREPYVATANFIPVARAHEAGILVNPRALLFCLPGVASYVGGDVTAGVLACGLDTADDVNILIDIGTNGEVVVGNKEFLVCAAASAGPAFEGSGVSCGMRSSIGAIQKVTIDPKAFAVRYETIGSAPARGICGSGYIDCIAAMLTCGLLDKDGKIKAIDNPRIRATGAGREFVLAAAGENGCQADIVITEADIDNIKRAKAAIYAAVVSLLKHISLDFPAIKRIFIAGGFGTSLDIASAITIGLLPALKKETFVFVGNSSLTGARNTILSEEACATADEIAHKMTYCELSVEPGYMEEYMAALFFPHTDIARFGKK
ncbi:MAG TPA: ASKHA domain-containing protein [Candidatus Omnitrophota bacterium]|nr:ASKHA domain-containing protein [Candidatus Omnitrophota bacterium]HRZ14979.1 ASKHA domain-containing protein [Candidatus Omnitrophota bacterium]